MSMDMKEAARRFTLCSALILPVLLAACDGDQAVAERPPVAQQAAAAAPAAAAVAKPPFVLPEAADAPRLLPLQGAVNTRTFAGLQGRNGAIPAGAFVRAGDLGKLTAADRDALAQAGVVLDIDLRTADEAAQSPDVLADDPRFAYKRISLLGEEKLDMSKLPPSLGEMYVQSLETSKPQFRQVFQTIAAQKDGTVLFHCTAGKDRTGMVSALLLDLAGVPRADIVHNYAISGHYFAPMAEATMKRPEMVAMLKAHPNMVAMMGSAPEDIEAFLDKLYSQYGDAESYLKSLGLSDADIHSLRVRLGQGG